jgi:thiol-disulfide isomerase/thioredoxin
MTGRLIKIAIIVFIVLFTAQFLLFSADSIKWESDWQRVLKSAVEKKQPVLMDFYTDWCPHCKRLDADTFVDKTVIDYFNKENYALLKVNPEVDRGAEEKFKVFSYPTLVIFKSDGSEIDRILGFKSPVELISGLENLKKGIGTLDDLLGKLKKLKPEDSSDEKFKLMFGINDKYIARADYPEALAMIDGIIELDKDNGKKQASSAMYQRGYIYYKWKKYKEAVDALVSIHSVYPQSEEAEDGYAAAAYYSEKLNDPALTLKLLKEFTAKFPDSKNLERIQKKIQKLEEQ